MARRLPDMSSHKNFWVAAGATALLAGAAYTRVESAKIAARHPLRGTMKATDAGSRFHVLEEGRGPSLVLLHGNAVTAEDWAASGVLDELSRQYHVIAPDRAGVGHSNRPRGQNWTPKHQADALADLIRSMDAEPALIVGHSLGTQVALRLALDHPSVVRGLVLVSGFYFPEPRVDSILAGVSASPLSWLFRHTFGLPIGQLAAGSTAKAMFSPERPPARFTRDVMEMCLLPSQMRACAADGFYMLKEAFDLQSRFSELTCPISIISGSDDKVVSPSAQSQRLAEKLENATCITVGGAGHMLHHSHSEVLLEAIEHLSAPAAPPLGPEHAVSAVT